MMEYRPKAFRDTMYAYTGINKVAAVPYQLFPHQGIPPRGQRLLEIDRYASYQRDTYRLFSAISNNQALLQDMPYLPRREADLQKYTPEKVAEKRKYLENMGVSDQSVIYSPSKLYQSIIGVLPHSATALDSGLISQNLAGVLALLRFDMAGNTYGKFLSEHVQEKIRKYMPYFATDRNVPVIFQQDENIGGGETDGKQIHINVPRFHTLPDVYLLASMLFEPTTTRIKGDLRVAFHEFLHAGHLGYYPETIYEEVGGSTNLQDVIVEGFATAGSIVLQIKEMQEDGISLPLSSFLLDQLTRDVKELHTRRSILADPDDPIGIYDWYQKHLIEAEITAIRSSMDTTAVMDDVLLLTHAQDQIVQLTHAKQKLLAGKLQAREYYFNPQELDIQQYTVGTFDFMKNLILSLGEKGLEKVFGMERFEPYIYNFDLERCAAIKIDTPEFYELIQNPLRAPLRYF